MADEKTRGDRDQLEGTAKELKGKIRGDLGNALDDRSQHLKGRAEELEGKIQKKIGEKESEDADERY